MAGVGNWSNAAVCKEVTVERGSMYKISMVIKTSIDMVPQTHWLEVVVMDTIPEAGNDGMITAWPNRFALNSWDCSDVTYVDVNFADNNCDAKSVLADTINPNNYATHELKVRGFDIEKTYLIDYERK